MRGVQAKQIGVQAPKLRGCSPQSWEAAHCPLALSCEGALSGGRFLRAQSRYGLKDGQRGQKGSCAPHYSAHLSSGFSPKGPSEPSQSCYCSGIVAVVQSLSRVQLSVTPWTAARQASLSFTISWSLLRLMSIEWVVPFNHLILCRPLLLLPTVFPSIRVFSNVSALRIPAVSAKLTTGKMHSSGINSYELKTQNI